MADDRRLRISSSRAHPDEVARHTFGTTRRGFDPSEVRAYLELVAGDLAAAAERERELRDLLAEAEHRAANPVLDEATLTGALGQETARVLRSAHDAAADVLARAESEAELSRSSALEESAALRERADKAAAERTAQTESAVEELRRRTQEETAASLDKARLEAEAVLSQARAECRAMVQEAQELRAKVLADLTRRRRVLHSQIEQLRAGRERLAETITGVRGAVDAIAEDLFRAEDEARLAAEEAGRQAAAAAAASDTDVETDEVAPGVAQAPAVSGTGAVSAATADAALSALEDADDQDDEARRQAVEDLFARLRAADELAEQPAPGRDEPTVGEAATAPEPARQAAKSPRRGAKRASGKGGTSSANHQEGEAPAAPEGVAGDGVPAPDADAAPQADVVAEAGASEEADPDLARREELLAPVITAMARRLKRALQDDQNDILDRLRGAGRWGPEVLPAVEDHLSRYQAAAAEHLTQAASLGVTFGGGTAGQAPDVAALSTELATAVVVPLRRRLDGEDGPSAEGGDDALVDRVGAAFREWKGARVERLAGDQAVAAFGLGTLAGVGSGTTLRWIVDDGGAECPDCDDNALAGPTEPGEAYPTGHAHPPAHAGCRCLIAPVTT
ncbi:MAG TPA: DivIVA domain-containing protein [Candidatus Sulfotelmatobacter sp.]|nr:DivIVA domain-containing protein [Candidatus Sulfotelmatobacter sp.]